MLHTTMQPIQKARSTDKYQDALKTQSRHSNLQTSLLARLFWMQHYWGALFMAVRCAQAEFAWHWRHCHVTEDDTGLLKEKKFIKVHLHFAMNSKSTLAARKQSTRRLAWSSIGESNAAVFALRVFVSQHYSFRNHRITLRTLSIKKEQSSLKWQPLVKHPHYQTRLPNAAKG